MAAAMSLAIISPSCSQPTLFHSKLFFRSASVGHDLPFLGSSVLLSHAAKVVARGASRSNSITCNVFAIVPHRRCRIIMDKPGGEGATREKIYDCYLQTLAKVDRISKGEAEERILSPTFEEPFWFECEIDIETLKKLRGLPDVRAVHQISRY